MGKDRATKIRKVMDGIEEKTKSYNEEEEQKKMSIMIRHFIHKHKYSIHKHKYNTIYKP